MEGITEDGEKVDVETLKSLKPEELKTIIELAKKQIETEQKKEEEERKKRIIKKIRRRMPSLTEEQLLQLGIEDLGRLSKTLKALDYQEPFIPLQRYTKSINWILEHWKGLTVLTVGILIISLLGVLL